MIDEDVIRTLAAPLVKYMREHHFMADARVNAGGVVLFESIGSVRFAFEDDEPADRALAPTPDEVIEGIRIANGIHAGQQGRVTMPKDPVEVVVSISDAFPRPVDYPTTDYDVARVTSDEPDPNAGGAAHAYAFWHGDDCVGALQFQHGPRNAEGSTPGAFQLQVVCALIDQFRGFMSGPYANDETEASLRDLESVRDRLVARRDARHARGALGARKV